jgi:tetratricopeptide (TPR) repeat protein
VQGAKGLIDKALAQNPKHRPALLLRASLQIDNARYDDAKKTLAQVLAVNPNDVEAHALLGTIAWLSDDTAGYEAEKKAALAVNPHDAAFFHTVSDFAVKEHRYRQAISLEEEALKLDPDNADALAGIGSGYLRLGEEQKGLEYLRKAWKRDSYNVRTYNILNLFDDTIAKEYVFVPSKHFKFRFQKDEKPILERYVPRLIEQAWADMVKRYGFTPTTPAIVELFADPDAYSVRTVGLPNLGALGVCFGQVITALSPSNGHVNWGMVLWHELGHVFAIQLSNSRVPRWFTEGLSEYETILARKEWRRENDVDVWMAMEAGTLPSVVELNSRFLFSRDIGEMVVAYHMSSLTIEFIGNRWGFPKIVQALTLYGQGKGDAEVIKAITGLDVAAFDAEFRKHLEQRFAPYKGTFKVRLSAYDDPTAAEKAAAATPKDADVQADVAVAYFVAQDADKTKSFADKALALDAKNKKALWVKAELAYVLGDQAGAKLGYQALIDAGGDGYDARLRLGTIAILGGDLTEGQAQLAKAKALDPQRSEPYALLAQAYAKAGKTDDELKELEGYADIEEMDDEPLKRLVDKYAARGDWAKVVKWGERRLDVNPYDTDLHLTLGDAYLAQKQWDKATFEYESALLCNPAPKRPAVAYLGEARAAIGKKDTKAAKRAIDLALKAEPQNAEALALKRQLGGGAAPR